MDAQKVWLEMLALVAIAVGLGVGLWGFLGRLVDDGDIIGLGIAFAGAVPFLAGVALLYYLREEEQGK